LKMHSYVYINAELIRQKTQKKNVIYPKNVTVEDYAYFTFAPTLVYETSYMRTDTIRWFYVLKEFTQAAGCGIIMHVILVQFMLPILKEDPATTTVLIETLRLATPSIILWLLGFYAIFHCYLNGLSELLRFADRQFYLDWWNAPTLEVFWRKWNIPVHNWLSSHIYRVSKKWGTKNAILVTFLFSAVLHEFIFGVAFKVLRPWFFLGMFIQVPLILAGNFIHKKLGESHQRRWGNILVWSSLFFGHPLIEILYFSEWFRKNQDFFCVEQTTFIWF